MCLQGIWAAAFSDSMDALRFTHAAQMLLMYMPWPRDTAPYLGADVPSVDGRWLFKGPRVCMAIHQTDDFEVCGCLYYWVQCRSDMWRHMQLMCSQ